MNHVLLTIFWLLISFPITSESSANPHESAIEKSHPVNLESKIVHENLPKLVAALENINHHYIQQTMSKAKIVPENISLTITIEPDQARIITGICGSIGATTSMAMYGAGCTNCCLLAGSCATLHPEKAKQILCTTKQICESDECAVRAEQALECCIMTTGCCVHAMCNPCYTVDKCRKIFAPLNMHRN
jgi:hypothetical protein